MKKLLLSTALLGAMAVPGLAQEQEIFRQAPEAMDIRASDFMGMRLYATEAAVEGDEFQGVQEGWEDIGEVNDIVLNRDGEVQAVLVDIGGFLGIGERTVAVSMDALQFLSDSATAENADDFFLVMNATREQLEGAPEYSAAMGGEMTAEQAAEETDTAIEDGASNLAAAGAAAGAAVGTAVEETGEEVANAGAEVADEAADAGEEVTEEVAQAEMTDTQEDQAEVADTQMDSTEEATEETAQAEMTTEGTATETEMEADQTADAATDTMATEEMAATDEAATMTDEEMASAEQTSAEARTPIVREGFVAAGMEDFTADRLQGAGVYDANDERVGEVGEILLSDDGQVSDLVIDVGGFLGIGEKPVALAMDSVDILRQDGGEEIRVYVSQTEDQLEGMERYETQQ